MKFQMF